MAPNHFCVTFSDVAAADYGKINSASSHNYDDFLNS
jgi:hypothetical protein